MAAREEPLFIVISTQSKDPLHVLSQLIDDGLSGRDPTTVCHLYAVPDDADDEAIFTDPKLWKLANPALGDFRSLPEMRTMAQRAKRMPDSEATFRNLYLNQRVDAKSPIIPRIEWEGCKAEYVIEDSEELYLGLDLSGSKDLTALVGVTVNDGSRVLAWFWKPEVPIRDHEMRDRVPYATWVKQGFVETTPGRAIQYDWVASRLAEISAKYLIKGMAFDRWRVDDFKNACDRVGLDIYVEGSDDKVAGAIRMVPWGQGFKDMAPSIDALESAVLDRILKHDGHPCLTWCMSNAMGLSDPAGNRKMDKSASRFRIDGAVALAMAVGLKSRDLTVEEYRSKYEDEGVLTF
jgi:phage terminase large subunit-like protein